MPGVFGVDDSGVKRLKSKRHGKIYRRYWNYYKNNSQLYTDLGIGLETKISSTLDTDQKRELRSSIKTLRTPIHRVCEFYATTMLIGTAKQAIPLTDTDEKLKEAIYKVWRWSNLDVRKQVLKRWLGIYGQVFIKVNSPVGQDRVWHQIIKPEYVTDSEKDDRGHIVYMRLDIPFDDAERELAGDKNAKRIHTEIWRKFTTNKAGVVRPGYFRVWDRDRDTSEDTVVDEPSLGVPVTELSLTEDAPTKTNFGFDFVPFVDLPAMDTGDKWPSPVCDHALPLVDEG